MTQAGAPGDVSGLQPHEHRRRLVVLAAVLSLVGVAAVVVGLDRQADQRAADAVVAAEAPAVPTTDPPVAAETTGRPPADTTTTPAPPGPEAMTLAFSGDLLPHMPVNARAEAYGRSSGVRYDYGPMLEPMAPVLEPVDVAICHLEVPVAADQERITGYPSFGSPVELVDDVAEAGFDGCSTASNHSLDQGMVGLSATLDRMDQAGLAHTGTARTAEEGAAVTTYEVDGAEVAHLSYAYDFNGYRIPPDAPFATNQIDVERIKRDTAAARRAGAAFVVVSLHWGTEYRHEPSQYQRDVVSLLLPWPDIDLVIGHHAHVVQPVELVNDTYVVWGLGNQLANQPEVPRSDGLTVVVTATQAADGRYRVTAIEGVPTFVDTETFRVLPVVDTLADPETPDEMRRLLTDSYQRTAQVLGTRTTPGFSVDPLP